MLATVVILGLASRRFGGLLPDVISRYAGDTLWAVAAVFGYGLIWPAASTRRLAVAAALTALAVELSQLAHPAWLDALRRQPGVALILGYDFVFSDLVCYAVGTMIGAGIDNVAMRRGLER